MHFDRQVILRRLSLITAWFTLFLIFVGGMVTSTDSGHALPTWPLAYGKLFVPMVGGVFYEYSHRMVAAVDMLLIFALAVLVSMWVKAAWLKILAVACAGLTLVQAAIGALTVRFLLPDQLYFTHGLVSQTIFFFTVILAYALSGERKDRGSTEDKPQAPGNFARMSLGLIVILYIQLIIGSIMRHTGSGLAIPDFPTMAGRWLPDFNNSALLWINNWRLAHSMGPVTISQVWLNFSHRLTALIVLLAAISISLFVWIKRDTLSSRLKQTLVFFDLFLVSQIVLGALVIWTRRQPVLATIHVVTGAVLFGLSTLLLLRGVPVSWHKFKSVFTRNNDEEKPLLEHLAELRSRLLRYFAILAVISLIAYQATPYIIKILVQPVGKLVFLNPTEAFTVNLKLAFLLGAYLSLPFLLYQIWSFMQPALKEEERRVLVRIMALALLLFSLGAAFCYFFIIPAALRFLLSYSYGIIQPMISAASYLSFIVLMLVSFGITFELPLLLGLLAYYGMVSPESLAHNRKIVIVAVFIFAALLTPTTDIFSQSALAIPLIAMYEISIIISRKVYQRRQVRI